MLYVLAGYLAVLVVLSLVRVVPVRSAALQRLRAFFPSWKFFDDVDVVPVLLVRAGEHEPWRPAAPAKLRRRWYALLVDPEATLALARGSLLAQLRADVEEGGDAEALVSYQLTRGWARAATGGAPYQFKVCLVEPGAAPGPDDDFVISPVYLD